MIPYSVQQIGTEAFGGCSALKSIVVESGNRRYDSREGCNAIIETATNTLIAGCQNTKIPHSVTTIGFAAFVGCKGLTNITIPNGVTTIGEDAFFDCENLTGITIPNSVTTIGDYAFSSCENLTSITIPNGITTIEKGTFLGCYALTSITIPNSVTTIGVQAFEHCYGLTSVVIPNSVTTIGDHAFARCENLTGITIPNSVTTIGDYAFFICKNLTGITIPNSVTTIGDYAFASCENLTSITIPNGITTIEEGTFSGCYALASITIPNSVTTIGEYAFIVCRSLISITIPNSVTTIGIWAFNSCDALKDIYCQNPVPCTIDEETFANKQYKMATLHVPTGAKAVYQAAKGWKNFTNIVQPKYEVRWVIDGEVIQTDYIDVGEPIVFGGEIPTKEGYTFSGWNYIPDTMPAEDVTITGSFIANTYMVTYLLDGEVYRTVDVKYGEAIPWVEEPTKEGHTFSGWSYIPDTMPAKDITITANFTINTYTVTFMVDGTIYKTAEVSYGEAIPTVEAPTKEGHTFSGWSEIPATMPAEDVTITANFTVNPYTVTYMIDGEVYKSVEVNYGEAIPTEEAPTKDGYSFSGWSYIPKTMPAEDIVISGSFILVDSIDGIVSGEDIVAVYTLDGKKVNKILPGKIYIFEYKDGRKIKANIR